MCPRPGSIGLLLAFLLIASPALGLSPSSEKRVLVLHSYHPSYGWTARTRDGIEFAFAGAPHVQVTHDYLDSKHHHDPIYLEKLWEVLQHKHADLRPDVVIACDNHAFQLALEHRDAFLSDVPLVFCGINGFSDEMIAGHRQVTGVVEQVDFASNIEVMLRLHPDARRIVVVHDATPTAHSVLTILREAVTPFGHRAGIEYLTDKTFAELDQSLAALRPGTVVLYVMYTQDRSGAIMGVEESIARVVAAARVPVYCPWEFTLGTGVLGGKVLSGFQQGEAAARQALAILDGRPADEIAIQRHSPAVYTFDATALAQHGVAEARLPAESTIINRAPSFLRRHRTIVLAVLAFLPTQSLVIGVLVLINRRNRRQAERTLRQREECYRTIFENTGAATLVIENDTTIRLTNTELSRMWGYSREEIEGKRSWKEFVHPADLPRMLDRHLRRRAPGKRDVPGSYEFRFVDRQGRMRDIFLTVAMIPGTTESVASLVDVTRQKRVERVLRDARQEADAANRLKSEFLANMSHEIRTPLTSILGFTNLAIESCTSACQSCGTSQPGTCAEHLPVVIRSAEHLLQVINDILDLSKIEAGKLVVEPQPCNPSQIIQDAVSLIRVRTEQKNLKLIVEGDGPIPATIRTDPQRMRQIILNLLGNACKFTNHGEVRLKIRLDGWNAPNPRLLCEVSDTGIGMTQSQIEGLFQPFSQVDTSSTRRFGGTGLGLTISRRLARHLGGEVELVWSKPQAGSCFRLTLDAGALTGVEARDSLAVVTSSPSADGSQQAARPEDVQLPDCRLLLAEDGEDNQRLLLHLLRRAGAEVDIVDNGRQAVRMVRQAAKEDTGYQVILMDMQMPVMDGYQATRKLRLDGYRGAIIALTAHAMDGDRAKCLQAGCDDYATKPVNRDALFALIRRYAYRSTTVS